MVDVAQLTCLGATSDALRKGRESAALPQSSGCTADVDRPRARDDLAVCPRLKGAADEDQTRTAAETAYCTEGGRRRHQDGGARLPPTADRRQARLSCRRNPHGCAPQGPAARDAAVGSLRCREDRLPPVLTSELIDSYAPRATQ